MLRTCSPQRQPDQRSATPPGVERCWCGYLLARIGFAPESGAHETDCLLDSRLRSQEVRAAWLSPGVPTASADRGSGTAGPGLSTHDYEGPPHRIAATHSLRCQERVRTDRQCLRVGKGIRAAPPT